MKTTAIGTLKGGVGKTMITFNLAAALAETAKVLVIDVDPQCNLSNNMGVDITDQDIYSSLDIFENHSVHPSNLVVEHPIPELPNLDIIPCNILLMITELQIVSRAARERLLKKYLDANKSFFEKYDHILIDTNPSMGIVNQNAFFAADSIILVTDIDDNSRKGLDLFIYYWGQICEDVGIQNNVKAIIVNRGDLRTNLTTDMLEYLMNHEDLSKILVQQLIKNKVAYTRAAALNLPVTQFKEGVEEAKEIYRAVELLKEMGVF